MGKGVKVFYAFDHRGPGYKVYHEIQSMEMNDYVIKTNYFIFIFLIYQTTNVLCPF